MFGVDCHADSSNLHRGHILRSDAKCLVCDIDLLRLNVLGRILHCVKLEFQGFSLIRSSFFSESAIARQFFSAEIFEVFRLQPEWNPVDDDATFNVFGGVLDSFGDDIIRQGDGVALGCIFLVQPKKDASSRKRPSCLEKFPWNLCGFLEECLQVGYSWVLATFATSVWRFVTTWLGSRDFCPQWRW